MDGQIVQSSWRREKEGSPHEERKGAIPLEVTAGGVLIPRQAWSTGHDHDLGNHR
jgi:hypothetical protein